MKENKHLVFALKSTKQVNEQAVSDGFLLFPDEGRANNFLAICKTTVNSNNSQTSGAMYEAIGYVEVNDFYANMVDNRSSFFVRDLESTKREV